jgi:UDP-N-acetylglucosamine--N-acetylmuramyl-(pentapeptide) pyrophosphoryl-undecaprenol N-acetylglucosamine transferase
MMTAKSTYQHPAEAAVEATSPAASTAAPRIMLAAGGTGGHVYPAIAIADAIKDLREDAVIQFIGTKKRMEWKAVPKAGYPIRSIWMDGFHRRFTLKNLLFPFKVGVSVMQSLVHLLRFKPDAVVACGGFASAPIGWVAAQKGVPLFVQEQNSFPGATNRLLAKHARKVFTAFKQADQYLNGATTDVAGNPTRASLLNADRDEARKAFGFNNNQPTLLVLGGSGGAKTINDAMLQAIAHLHNDLELNVIWQCGQRYFEAVRTQIKLEKYTNLRLATFIDDMAAAYAVADLAVSRAGASSCSELTLTGTASVLIPSPNVAGDHQHKNAEAMVESGAAELLEDAQAQDQLGSIVERLITDQQQLELMRHKAKELAKPDAAQHIAKEILRSISADRAA